MRIPVKLLLLIGIAISCGLLGLTDLGRAPHSADASPQTLTVTILNNTLTVQYRLTDDIAGSASGATLSGTAGLGTFTVGGTIPADGGVGCSPTGITTNVLTYTTACIDGVDVDVIEEVQPPSLLISATWQCTGAGGLVTFTLSQAVGLIGGTNPLTQQAQCPVNNGGGAGVGAGQIAITATPNALICGGTTTLTASARDSVTGIDDPHVYHFQTDVGQLLQQSDTKAILALLPGQLSATVTATTIAIPLNASLDAAGNPIPVVLTATIVIQNFCAGPETVNGSISVVAAPNVIPCGGTAQLTATARDQSGNIIPGVGFSWSTDAGGLIAGPPNTATSTAGTATLTLLPGQGKTDGDYDALDAKGGVRSANVTVNVGTRTGTVKVQQYCPGVTSDGSSTPGKIVLIPSQSSVNCLGNSFIGAIVKDSKGQVPPNDTEVTFISTSGFFTGTTTTAQGSASSTTTGVSATPTSGDNSTPGTTTTTTTTGQYIAKTTKNGALNVIFNAGPNSNGQVSITAAAGASFGSTTIVVNCPTAITAGFGGGSAAGGLGLLGGLGGALRPPNTGEGGQIRPPNTGDAGLAETGSGSNNTTTAVALSILAGALTSALALKQRRS